jgi:hypothetical protein
MALDNFRHEQQERRNRLADLSEQAEQLTKDAEKPTPYWQAMLGAMTHVIETLGEKWNPVLREQPEPIDIGRLKTEIRKLRAILEHRTMQRARAKLNSLSGQVRTLKIQIAGGKFSRWMVAQARKTQRFLAFLFKGLFK